MGRDRLRKYAGVITCCKQLGNRIVGVHPIVLMDFWGARFLFNCITQLVRKRRGNNNKNKGMCSKNS